MRLSIRHIVPVLLLSACVPAALHQSAPAPENALACARESLERLGYAAGPTSARGNEFWARRTVDSAWVHRVQHVVNVFTRAKAPPELHVRGERVYNKSGGPELPGVSLPEPQTYGRRVDADELLATEVSQVVRECGGSPRGQASSAR